MDMQGMWPMVAIASTAIAGGVYVIRAELRGDVTRLDGRINSHEAACERRQQTLDERHEESNRRLESIEDKLDRLLEFRR